MSGSGLPKVTAFLEEFPFLLNYIDNQFAGEIKVQRVDVELIKMVPEYWVWDRSSVRCSCIYLLDKTGRQMYQVKPAGRKLIEGRLRWWDQLFGLTPDDVSYFETLQGETVAIAIKNLPTAPAVHYIVLVTNSRVCVYKVPKNFTLLEWLSHETKREQENLNQQLTQIDDVKK